MTVTLTYDSAQSRIRIDANGLGAAETASIERSTDQIQWTTVRGATGVTVVAGALEASIYDWEFRAGVTNYYRVRALTDDPAVFIASGASAVSANTLGTSTVSPALPAGMVDGDLMVIEASIRNSGAGTVDTPAGWTQMFASGNVALLGRRFVTGDVAPTVSFTGGVPNATILARCHGFRNAHLSGGSGAGQLNASAQDVAYPALTVPVDNMLVLVGAWKQDAWTTVAQLAGMTEIADNSTTSGDDASQALDYVVQTTKANINAGSFVVTGGISAISRGFVVAVERAAFITEQTASVTPYMDRIWLKSPTRPFLNRVVTVVGWDEVARPARSSTHDVVNRSYPIAVGDLRGSRQFTLRIHTPTTADRQTMDYVLASGDVLFVHTPPDCEVPGGYVRVGDSAETRTRPRATTRVFALPCTEVAPPGPDMTYAQSTWATVLALYATWDALLAAHPTWDSVLGLLGDPSEVVVP